MQDAVLIRLRPNSPWRFGPGETSAENSPAQLDTLYRSDRLFSAVSLAARQLGWLEQWLDSTARSQTPAVSFTSLFPFHGETLFAPPPSTLWPPPASLVTTPHPVFLSKIRWNAARFVPLQVIESILIGQPILADQWLPDADSGCLLRRDRPSSSPFRASSRNTAAIDRLTRTAAHASSAACIEFEPTAGLWTVARYAHSAARDAWNARLESAFRLLADSGFGGRRTSGWGQCAAPEFQHGAWPALLMPKLARQNGKVSSNGDSSTTLYWLLSLYSPSRGETVDWTAGDYQLVVRGGRIEGVAASGALKKSVRMVAEGSVLATQSEPVGIASDVAPAGFAHPVYRSGFAVALKLPQLGASLDEAVEKPNDKEALALELRPCDKPASNESAPAVAPPDTDEIAEQPSSEISVNTNHEEPSGNEI